MSDLMSKFGESDMDIELSSQENSQTLKPMQPQHSGTSRVHEPSTMPNRSSESQFSNDSQRFSNKPDSAPGQPNQRKQIPFGNLLPFILSELDIYKSLQLTALYGRLRKNEISKEGFVRLMRNIVGDQMLKLAVVKLQAKREGRNLLYPLVEQLVPEKAAEVTEMLLKMDQTVVSQLLESPYALKAKVSEAMEVLQQQPSNNTAEQFAALSLDDNLS